MVRTYRYNPALMSTFCLAHARGAEDFQTLANETQLERLASERKKAATALRRRQPKRDLLEESEVSIDGAGAPTYENHSGEVGASRSRAKNPCRPAGETDICEKCFHSPCEHFYCCHSMENTRDRECMALCSNWPFEGWNPTRADQYFCCIDPNSFHGHIGAFHSNLHDHGYLMAPYAPSVPCIRPAVWQAGFSNSGYEARRGFHGLQEGRCNHIPSADLTSTPQLNADTPGERVRHDCAVKPSLPAEYSTMLTTSPLCRQCAALQSSIRKPFPSIDDGKGTRATDLLSFLNRHDRLTMMPTQRIAVPDYPRCYHVENGLSHSCQYSCPFCVERSQRQGSDDRAHETSEARMESTRLSPEAASHCRSCSTVSSGMASLRKEAKKAKQQYDEELMQQIEEKRHAKEQQLIKEREEDGKLAKAIEAVLAKEKQEVNEEQRAIAGTYLKQERRIPSLIAAKSIKPAATEDNRPGDGDLLEWWEKQPEAYRPQTPSTPSEPVPALRFNSYLPRDFEEPVDLNGSPGLDDAYGQKSTDESEKRKLNQAKPKKLKREYSRWSDWSDDEKGTKEGQIPLAPREDTEQRKTERTKQRKPRDVANSQRKAIKEKKSAQAQPKTKQDKAVRTTAEEPTIQQLDLQKFATIGTVDFSSQVDFPDPELDEVLPSEQPPAE